MKFDLSQKEIKRALLAVLLIAVMLVCICVSVFGAETYTKKYGIVTTSPGYSLHVRNDATTSSSIVTKLSSGDTVVINGEKDGQAVDGNTLWYLIETGDGQVGYVTSEFIEITGNVTTAPPEETTAPDETTGEETTGDETTGDGVTGDVTTDGETTGGETPDEPPTVDFEAYLTEQGFPESYKTYLRELHEIYPNWIFKAQHVEYDFDYAVQQEKLLSLVHTNSKSSWKSVEGDAYDWATSTWVGFDGASWVRASEDIIRHYMDPRNFLGVNTVFQFLEQSYDGSIQNLDGVKQIIAGTFMENDVTDADGSNLNYATAIYNAGAEYGANPYVLAAMLVQEQGAPGTSGLISGTYPGYEGYYNFFNVGAYASGGMNAIQRGLWYAKGGNDGSTSNLRPWTTRLKAIVGGTYYYASGYINAGQNTLYLKKFNVQGDRPFTHQYMTNIQGAESESISFARGYTQEMRSTALSFYIPVYKNMPEEACPKPELDGSPNMKLSSLSVKNYELTPEFYTDTLEYMLVVPPNVNSIFVEAVAMDSTATIAGLGELVLNGESNVFEIKVTAGNGTVRVYKLTVAKENSDAFGKVTFTENYKTKDFVVYGISPGMTVASFKAAFVSEGSVIVKSSAGVVKGDAEAMATEDILQVYSTKDMLYGEYRASVKGDLNCDGRITISDLLKVRNKILGTDGLSSSQLLSGDIDGGGSVNISDLLKIRNHILGTASIS